MSIIYGNMVGGSGSCVQPDWNQNDNTQPDYVKNRPFYTGNTEDVVLVEETTVPFEARDGGIYIGLFETTFLPIAGQTYKISWDGSVYESTCIAFYETLVIGNLSVIGEGSDTGEPFLFDLENSKGFVISTVDTSASHTISISETVTPVVKIDKKYIYQPDWNQNDTAQPDYVKNRPFYTIPPETLLAEFTNAIFADLGVGKYMSLHPCKNLEFVSGNTYKVSWDGTLYTCDCIDFAGSTAIGNISIVGEGPDTGEPFLIGMPDGLLLTVAIDTSPSHSFSIRNVYEQAVKIDKKYLSEMPNPNKLTFTGAVSAEYDGSEELSVAIPSADWNQNYGSHPDYINNRPFYSIPPETLLMEANDFKVEGSGNGTYHTSGIYKPKGFTLIVGESYKVSWDGTVHECIAGLGIFDYVYLGNLSLDSSKGPDTGEPFLVYVTDGTNFIIYTNKGYVTHSISIRNVNERVVKIDEKYLPDVPDVDTTLSVDGKAADAKATGDAIRSLSEEIITTSESKVAAHNIGTDTHSDIRLLIQGLTDRLNALADSDDTTLDQLSEVVAYIKSNRSLIESITTSKVSVADIVDNLTTNVSNKPLSAAQGVVIKTLIDALRNDKLDAAELTNAVNTALAQAKASGEFDGADGQPGADGYTPVKGVDYFDGKDGSDANVTAQNIASALGYTPANDANVESLSSNQSALSARMDTFTALGEGSTTGDAELMDARVDCEGKTWANAGGHIRGITEKIIDACCDKIVTGSKNYNLLKPSECVYMYRQQDDTTELKASNTLNLVTGWIPVEYGKYYTISRGTDSGRVTYNADSASLYTITRVQAKHVDNSISIVGISLIAPGSVASNSTVYINDANIIAYRVQIHIGKNFDISTPELLEAQKVMCTSGDTLEESLNNAKTYEYISGDAAVEQNIEYSLKHDDTKADKTEVEAVNSDISELRNRKVSVSPKYNGNYIPNDRFLRSISNLRDSANAKEFAITINNNSGATIKNAAIAVGMHNTVGITPANNNLPFQVYDNVFSKPTGFKFYDGDTELPYYIESESDCNYIVDKNIKTDQKTMAVFSDGKIAVYNATKARMQLSANDGASWTNICDNITSRPYRVLLPDSQDNLFVASNDGKKLYKYTSADGYKAGTEVIDLTDTDTCIGSILAEDSEGNLYLGTYQTVFHCVIRKSTDHGNTWTIVFDVTNCQHVHNIFVNKKVTPNEIFIGLDNSSGDTVETHVSTDAGATWTKVNVPYGNRDYAFRYAGENFYIGCGERLYLGGATLYKTTDYNDPNAYYPLFDNGQGIRDIINVIEGNDDVLIAGGCVDAAVHQQQLFLSADRGETWKTVLVNPDSTKQDAAGKGLRTFSRKGNQILSETSTGYAMRFVYGNGAKTVLAIVNVGDIPVDGKTITLKTGYVANIEQMDDVLTEYENIDGKVADIQICDGYIVDKVSNKRVMTDKTEMVNSRIKIGQTSEYKILAESAYRLKDSINLGKLSRLNFTKGFTVSLLFRKEDGKKYLEDYNEYPIFQSGDTKLVLYRRSLRLVSGSTSIWGDTLYIQDSYLGSVNEDYVRLTVYFTADELPSAGIYTENKRTEVAACAEYPIDQNLSGNDFIVGSSLAGAPNIARIEIYNRVLTHGEIMALTNGCNLVTDGSMFN